MSTTEKPRLWNASIARRAAARPDHRLAAMPIHQTTSFVFKNTEHAANLFALNELGWIYTRLMNPTTDVFEQRMAALDGGVGGLALASGMRRSPSLFNLVHAGGHVVSAAALSGGTITLFSQTFKRLGIEVTFVDATDPRQIAAADSPPTRGRSTSKRWPIRRTTCSTIE